MSFEKIRFHNTRTQLVHRSTSIQKDTTPSSLTLRSVCIVLPVNHRLTASVDHKNTFDLNHGELLLLVGFDDLSISTGSTGLNHTPVPTANYTGLASKSSLNAIIVQAQLDESFDSFTKQTFPTQLHVHSLSDQRQKYLIAITRLLVINETADTRHALTTRNRLTELLFVEAIDYCISQVDSELPINAIIPDKRFTKALRAVHEHPEETWTLNSLAKLSGMSRSLFAEKFRTTYQETPLTYVRRCRIQKAKTMLAESNESIDQIARNSGYASTSSFVKAFRKMTGCTPSTWRNQQS